MADLSHLDKKYFIDHTTYNCPFCNRRNIRYSPIQAFTFDWSEKKRAYGFVSRCSSCQKDAMHLSNTYIYEYNPQLRQFIFNPAIKDIDSEVFYSVPTSFNVVDERIPHIFRGLITEAEGCLKMNYLTGASACVRKAIYELLIKENAIGEDYEKKIKNLKEKHPAIDPSYFDILSHIQEMTSDKIHEQSWDKWDSKHINLFLETLKNVFHEIYVIPAEKKERVNEVQKVLQELKTTKKDNK